VASPQRKLATYADLLGLPTDTREEVLGGDVILSPAPPPRHSKAQGSARHFPGGPFKPLRKLGPFPAAVAAPVPPERIAEVHAKSRELTRPAQISSS